jgi:hypothetical protein
MSLTREQILDREFIRPNMPGLRRLTRGVLAIAKALGVSELLPKEAPRPPDPENDIVIFCYLLDESHDRATIQRAGQMERAEFIRSIADYAFNIPAAKLALVQEEITMSREGVAASDYRVAKKPGETGGDIPPGKS